MMAPSQKRAYVSQETAERLAALRRTRAAAEGRNVTTDDVVAELLDAAEGKTAGEAELFAHPKGMQFTVSISIPEARLSGVTGAEREREARRAMVEWLEGVD
ncbi:MAG: hypothetical protein WBK88_07160 [Methanothrix sp.]